MMKHTSLPSQQIYSLEEWEQLIKDGNFKLIKTLLQKKTLKLPSQLWQRTIQLIILNCQYGQAEDIFCLLLKHPDKDIYTRLKSNGTLLHLIVSKLSFSTYQPDKVNVLCKMAKSLLETEAQERIQSSKNKSLFLDQIKSDIGFNALHFINGESEPGKSVKQRLENIITKVEKKYPEIISLKAEVERLANGQGYTVKHPSTSTTLSQRNHISQIVVSPLSSGEQPQQAGNSSSFWWHLFSWLPLSYFSNNTSYSKLTSKCD